jgi:Nuclease A inhibitor-like protein
MANDDEVERQLREATRGLTFMSESDYPVEVVRWPASAEVTPEYLRGLTGEGDSTPVEEVSVEVFFRNAAAEPGWKGGAELETARRYQRLLGLMKGNLRGARAYRVGRVNLAVYTVGRGPGGDWLGVATRVVET